MGPIAVTDTMAVYDVKGWGGNVILFFVYPRSSYKKKGGGGEASLLSIIIITKIISRKDCCCCCGRFVTPRTIFRLSFPRSTLCFLTSSHCVLFMMGSLSECSCRRRARESLCIPSIITPILYLILRTAMPN